MLKTQKVEEKDMVLPAGTELSVHSVIVDHNKNSNAMTRSFEARKMYSGGNFLCIK